MSKTSIQWTDRTWNPIRGCSRVSPGCINCYAERQAARFSGAGEPFNGYVQIANGHPQWTGKVELVEKHLCDPVSWRAPQRVFVNSMSDLFHEGLSFEDIDEVFTAMVAAPRHTFQILTKRHRRMVKYFWSGRHDDGPGPDRATYHLNQNIWLGVSVEDRKRKVRIDSLRETPAEVRFLSLEPLLEDLGRLDLTGIHWVIVGGESGPGARPFGIDWARSIRDQCWAAGAAFFMKQVGRLPNGSGFPDGFDYRKRDLHGGDWDEWPEDLRIREFPKVSHG